ncbi:MAG: folate family ECF transporter S component [Firmicutes bacterium]|nr:folate family ECF transporter S component [Bacillota bacterium]
MIVVLALLIAMEIVMNRFLSINAWNMKIGFSFLPIVIAAILFGPVHAAIVGGLGDFIGALLFPIGAYFPGFTLTAVLMGLVWGFFLHKKQSIVSIIIAAAINQLMLGLYLNTYWISVLYGSEYGPLFVTRILQAAILFVVQTVVIYAMEKFLPRLKEAIN